MFGCSMRMSNVVIAAIGTFFGGPNAQMMSRMLNVTLKFPGSMSGFAEAIKVYLQTSENNFDCRQCLRRVVFLIFETASDGIKRLANPTELRAAETIVTDHLTMMAKPGINEREVIKSFLRECTAMRRTEDMFRLMKISEASKSEQSSSKQKLLAAEAFNVEQQPQPKPTN